MERAKLPGTGSLILAEKFLGIFDEADDDYDGGASHAHEEHDLKDVHCEQANLKHEDDCNPDWLRIPFPIDGQGGGSTPEAASCSACLR
jgi:hypothetical protein